MMLELDKNSCLRPRRGVVFRQVEGEGVLLDTRAGTYFGLNETGVLLWRILDPGPATMAVLEAGLTQAFGETPDTLRTDLETWVRELQSHDLLEIG